VLGIGNVDKCLVLVNQILDDEFNELSQFRESDEI